MSQFIESILIEQGEIPLLEHHQNRINTTCQAHNINSIVLSEICPEASLQIAAKLKWRIVYNSNGVIHQEVLPYFQKTIHRLIAVDIGSFDYRYKYADRTYINTLTQYLKPGEDILMIKEDLILDTSYGNIAYYQDGVWFTPSSYLLNGCRRSFLLESGKIKEAPTTIHSLGASSHISIFNALIPLGRIILPTSSVQFSS